MKLSKDYFDRWCKTSIDLATTLEYAREKAGSIDSDMLVKKLEHLSDAIGAFQQMTLLWKETEEGKTRDRNILH